ncbi:hypothetical protein BDY24DRAFT_416458 [Mrakia frigida]|uniref:uncharacterized protein n=1 Tax=Mrakia frigida TaxID=29902 RepID=UPI003FCC1317
MLNHILLKIFNLLVVIPFLATHAYLVAKLSESVRHKDHDLPVVTTAGWAFWGFIAIEILALTYAIIQFAPSSQRLVTKVIGLQLALFFAYEVALLPVWLNHDYLASFFLSLFGTLGLLKLYFDVYFNEKTAEPCSPDGPDFAIFLLVSTWAPWSLYLTIFTGFQAVHKFTTYDERHGGTGTRLAASLALTLLAASSLIFSLRTRKRPAGDFDATAACAWILWGVFSASRDGVLRGVSGLLATFSTLTFIWSLWTTYEAWEANAIMFNPDEEARRRAGEGERERLISEREGGGSSSH